MRLLALRPPRVFLIVVFVAGADRVRVVFVVDVEHLQQVILGSTPFLAGIRFQRFFLSVRVQLLPGPCFVSQAGGRRGEAGQHFSSWDSRPFLKFCTKLLLPIAPVSPGRRAPDRRGRRA